MQNRTHLVKQNPLYSVILITKVLGVTQHQGLERTYHLSKSNKVLKTLKACPGMTDDLSRLDHNRLLDLYPEYEYIFGPYVDSNEHEFNSVYLLFTNHINKTNKIRVLYAGRVLKETDVGVVLPYSEVMRDEDSYKRDISSRAVIPGKYSNHCYYLHHVWSAQEVAEVKRIYGAVNITVPRYNNLRENFACNIMMGVGNHINCNPYRVLYEIHHAKRRLADFEVVSPINGKKADLRPDNVMVRDLRSEEQEKVREAQELYELDVGMLEWIYGQMGFDRFRGVYTYESEKVSNGLFGRKYVKMVKSGTDLQYTTLLSRAIMSVAEGRLLKEDETVDHIDHDNTNDKLSNLRIVSRSAHTSGDAIQLHIDKTQCCVCDKSFMLDSKQYSYYKLSDYCPTCSDHCKSTYRHYTPEQKEMALSKKKLSARYYILDKDTKRPRYFPPTLTYKQCRQALFNDPDTAFTGS